MPPPIPPSPEQVHDLEILVDAHHPLLFFETVEEERVEMLLKYLADRVGLRLFVWSPLHGLQMQSPEGGRPAGTEKPDQCLAFIEQANLEALFFLPGFPELDEPVLRARIKSIYRRYFGHRGQVIFTAPEVVLPPDVEPLFTPMALPVPTVDVYHRFVSGLLSEIGERRTIEVDLSARDVSELLRALHGLSFASVAKIITQAVIADGRLDQGDLEAVLQAKRRIIERSGILQYFPHEHRMADVAGLVHLKDWLRRRHAAFRDAEAARAFGLSPPKGLLLLGVQGCGKSLCAKAIAAEWRLPLIRLDPGQLFQKYFGESERNLRRAIRIAEDMAPVVLWVDEIEKGLSQGGNDGGTSQRIFGTFLSWLQEKKENVFVIATANDISALPPELLRKGRFDEIFFVDLPGPATRERIFAVHLGLRKRDARNFDLPALAAASEGFSGAEIEQAVVSALYAAFGSRGDIDSDGILEELRRTRPLSVTMAEKLQALRSWAHERAVPAD